MSLADEIQRLADLYRQGLLSDAEFSAAKARLLAAGSSISHAPVGSRLRRLPSAGWVGGVCAGLAQATGSEVWLWRLAFVCFTLLGGSGVLAYLLLWIFVPRDPSL